jgi:hypothetical protein
MAQKKISIGKFYFFDYFYILLRSISEYELYDDIFKKFIQLKNEFNLGESKYKKLVSDNDSEFAEKKVYNYTYRHVIKESLDYNLIEKKNDNFMLTDEGRRCINIYEQQSSLDFNKELLIIMEKNTYLYHDFIKHIYEINSQHSGLLIFPRYSPLKLGYKKSEIQTTGKIIDYLKKLENKINSDINKYIGINQKLNKTEEIFSKLINDELLEKNEESRYDPNNYNKIIKRIRDFWQAYFLKEIYKLPYSNDLFYRMIYRGKQAEILQATEFYPKFDGLIVYPLSIISKEMTNKNFKEIINYGSESLYIYKNEWNDKFEDIFIDSLNLRYQDLREINKNTFISLNSLQELVCYNLKISKYDFDNFLENTYNLNLKGKLRINISLEVDRLPHETNAMYLKREPIKINGQFKNIIAIEQSKRRK